MNELEQDMSVNPVIQQAMLNMVHFGVIVDGDFTGHFSVGGNIHIPLVAGLRSDPKIIEMSQEEVNTVTLGWTHDGSGFQQPSESL
jgi:hypothetical protein